MQARGTALAHAREIELVEGAEMHARWWAHVQARTVESSAALAALSGGRAEVARADPRWRRVARLPVLARAVPGFADLWRQEAPEELLERSGDLVWLRSPCGERLALPVDRVVFCPDDCGRWVLRLADGRVLVKRWPREAAA